MERVFFLLNIIFGGKEQECLQNGEQRTCELAGLFGEMSETQGWLKDLSILIKKI